jgi:hypothetical protein
MPIQVQGSEGWLAEVGGTTFRALNVNARPINYGIYGIYSIGAVSGTIAAGLSGNASIFQFRWAHPSALALLYAVSVSAGRNVAPTVDQNPLNGINLVAFKGNTTSGSGGTTLSDFTPLQLRTMGTSKVTDMRIIATTALTLGTIASTYPLSIVQWPVTSGALTIAMTGTFIHKIPLFEAIRGQCPYIMADDEGFGLSTQWIQHTTMTWHLGVQLVWAEAEAF